jgi:hypothetical protein
MRRTTLLWLLVAGCKNDGAAAPGKSVADDPPVKLAGVYPDRFECSSIASLDALGQILGGTAKQIDSAMSVPRGLPHPCNYEVQGAALEYWTFDLDCRDGMKQRADALFAQYTRESNELVSDYNTLSDAGRLPKQIDGRSRSRGRREGPRSPRPGPDLHR